MAEFEVDFRDLSLFGNSASEDEDSDIFESYALRRDEVDTFISNNKICIIKTLKGCGKSAILRIAMHELMIKKKIFFSITLTDISPEYENEDPDLWVKKWKEVIYTRIAEEIGALNDIPLDEFKENIKRVAIEAGRRKANFLDRLKSVLSSLTISAQYNQVKVGVTAGGANTLNNVANPVIAGLNDDIYIFIDDIDHNFINEKKVKARLVGFLTACRYISNETPGIKFRITLRPNSWNIIKREYPSMNSHVSQYIISMHWAHGEIKKILQKRICGYIKRRYGESVNISEKDAFDKVFKKVLWDNNLTDASQPIATYSKRRPRWAKEIFRIAAEIAKSKGKNMIDLDDINMASNNIGDNIIDDIEAEFSCEYSNIGTYVRQFFGQKNSFKEDELMRIIKNRILTHISDGLSAKEIAHALFYCGILYAREDFENGRYQTYYYEDKPFLFAEHNDEAGKYTWGIDLIFRNVLKTVKG